LFSRELDGWTAIAFRNLGNLDIVGVYPNYGGAFAARIVKAPRNPDTAGTRYLIVHLDRLPDSEAESSQR
jgi:Domain of unknown function (DUF4170)